MKNMINNYEYLKTLDFSSLDIIADGKSKTIYALDKETAIMFYKPHLRSVTYNREGIIKGTDVYRMYATMFFMNLLEEKGIPTQRVNDRILDINGKYAILLEDAEVNFYHFYLQMLHHEIDVKRDCIILPLNISREQLAGIDDSIDMIELNHDELGRAAAELLIWRLANPTAPCRRVMIAPELIEGKHSPAE